MSAFLSGPFEFSAAPKGATINGQKMLVWSLQYGAELLGTRTLPATDSQDQVREAFAADISDFKARATREHAPEFVELIDFETGDRVGGFYSLGVPEMTPGLIDDRSRYWLRTADKLYSRPVSLSGFAALAYAHGAPERAWISGLLSDEIITDDPEEWRAPTSWELRHVVGEGSLTGISGAKAAALVGVTQQNFRKYTARTDARTRQAISFAMWHLLLHKMGVKRA